MAYRSSDLYADTSRNQHKIKRIVFYGRGLKIYGLMPHLLTMRLKGQFISNYWVADKGDFYGAGIVAPTNEANYTAIPYQQSPENSQRLLDWLLAGKGFEYAIAGPEDFKSNIWQSNVGQFPPEVWVPGSDTSQDSFVQVLAGDAGNVRGLLVLPEQPL
ncbi:MAG: hypothetical protein WBB01_06450 [Phormidesmis sp.]